jgi:hypothetical protein
MSELLRKEWRENRALVFGLMALGPLALFGLRFLPTHDHLNIHPASPAAALLPFLMLIYVLAIGADLIAADASSGRIAFLAAQPVRPATLWTARAAFLFGSAAVYFAYLVGVEMFLLLFEPIDPTSLFRVGKMPLLVRLVPVGMIAAGTLFWSTLIDRGFAAALASLATIGLIAGAIAVLHPEAKKLHANELALPVLLLFAAFLTGSYLAFTRGRIHLGGRLRRLALAASALVVLFVLPAALALAKEIP